MINLNHKTILISRTDSIGDVVLTLPMCVWLKQQFTNCKIIFLGNTYTHPVISCLPQIDEIIEWKNIASLTKSEQIDFIKKYKIDVCIHVFPKKEIASLIKQAGVKTRVGTSHRLFNWFTCNIRPSFSRKSSLLHESQLNFELLKPFGLKFIPSLTELSRMMSAFTAKNIVLPDFITNALLLPNPKVILHTKSQGSAIEWPIENYQKLAQDLLQQGYQVFYTGTQKEGELIKPFIPKHPNCIDTTGSMDLNQLINFISKGQTLVACSTGPMHLAGILGIKTIGLFSSIKPIHPGRWSAIGNNVINIVSANQQQNTLESITVDEVLNAITKA